MALGRVVLLLTAAFIGANAENLASTNGALVTCNLIATKISSASAVFFPGSPQYMSDNAHATNSSSQASVCSVEPGNSADVATILSIISKTRDNFAVKGGGHAYHQKFSSTTGIQISMTRFNSVVYNVTSNTATLGAGLIWDDVYAALEPYGVNVLGGRIQGIGVAGFTLGGGYSWLTNQYGLGIDTVTAFELVTPDGKVRTVTENSSPDLFFALKGGYNNFGIITKFTLKTSPQGQVWGGIIAYVGALYSDTLTAAVANFSSTVKDPKAEIIFNYSYQSGAFVISALMFYDGPTPPAGIFDVFLSTPSLFADVSTRSFTQLIASFPNVLYARAIHGTVPAIQYTTDILTVLRNHTEFWGARLAAIDPTISIAFSAEPFLPSILSHGGASAYPPRRDIVYLPTSIDFAWTSPVADIAVNAALVASLATITVKTLAAGQNISSATPYGNYAYNYTSNAVVFGANLPRLRTIKAAVDPTSVMNLAGGWKI